MAVKGTRWSVIVLTVPVNATTEAILTWAVAGQPDVLLVKAPLAVRSRYR
jgi:hypothetical protein